jgi:hypothetical protein
MATELTTVVRLMEGKKKRVFSVHLPSISGLVSALLEHLQQCSVFYDPGQNIFHIQENIFDSFATPTTQKTAETGNSSKSVGDYY